MKKCPYDGGDCRDTLGCDMGICAKEVDDNIDDWSKEHDWDEEEDFD